MATTAKPTTFTRTSKSGEVQKVLDLVRDRKLRVVDVKFCDLPGTWQHFSIPASALEEDVFREGLGFDGSSIRGFQEIQESDMILMPDSTTAYVDPPAASPLATPSNRNPMRSGSSRMLQSGAMSLA